MDPITISLFAEKAELLAVEVPKLIKTQREIEFSIATIITHQAVELALKAVSLNRGKQILEGSGKTIPFEVAIDRGGKGILENEEIHQLNVLNYIRNQIQHSALFRTEYPLDTIIQQALVIIDKLFKHLGRESDEFDMVIKGEILKITQEGM